MPCCEPFACGRPGSGLSARAEFVQNVLPRALRQMGVDGREVGFGKRHPQYGFALNLILGLNDLFCFCLILDPEAGAVAGFRVEEVVD